MFHVCTCRLRPRTSQVLDCKPIKLSFHQVVDRVLQKQQQTLASITSVSCGSDTLQNETAQSAQIYSSSKPIVQSKPRTHTESIATIGWRSTKKFCMTDGLSTDFGVLILYGLMQKKLALVRVFRSGNKIGHCHAHTTSWPPRSRQRDRRMLSGAHLCKSPIRVLSPSHTSKKP